MSFLNPVILFAAVTAVLPVLIHLFARNRTKTIPFSSLFFLKELQNRQMRRIRIRQILLLILRTLILLFLVLAFARPTLKQRTTALAEARAQTRIALILDNSFSMQRNRENAGLLEHARRSALTIADMLEPGDELNLIAPTDTGRVMSQRSFSDKDAVARELEQFAIDERSADMNAALACALNRLRGPGLNKEIFILSDFQAGNLEPDSLAEIPESVRIYGLLFESTSVYNLTVQNMQWVSTILQVGQTVEAIIEIKNTGTQPVESALVQVYVENDRVKQFPVSLSVGETRQVSFRFPLEHAGAVNGRVVLSQDDIAPDNIWHFAFEVPERTKVALYGETDFIKLVLDRRSPFLLQDASLDAQNRDFMQSDVTVFSNIARLDYSMARDLRDYVEQGNGVVLILGERTDLRAFNQTLAEQLDLPRLLESLGDYGSQNTVFTLGTIDKSHPLFSGIFLKTVSFEKPEFYFALRAERSQDIDPIMSYSDGSAFLYEKRLGRGTVLVMTTGQSPRLSDLTFKTIFAPLTARMIRYAGTRSAGELSVKKLGQPLNTTLPALYAKETLTVHHPDHIDHITGSVTPEGRLYIHYEDTQISGMYGLYADSELLNQWAVNVEPNESDFTIIQQEILDSLNINMLEPGTDIKTEIQANRYGTELWPFFAWAVLLLIVLEMMVYRVPVKPGT
ncbi:MAG: BatA domain-containing protein [candidate division KSB1 bacterium]|nr:BatA domain-containing protein [candidate division KSB1 bacterium]